MRIGFALYGSLDGRSGGFRYDRKLVEGLRAAGDEVTVVELPWRSYPRGLLDNLSYGPVDRLAGVDVLLQDELAHPSLAWANRRLDAPIVSVVHHLRASERRRLAPVYRRIERRYLAGVDAAICNSEATRRTVLDTGALDADETAVIPPAGDRFDPDIDPAEIDARAGRGPLRVVFVGNLLPRKGVTTLVDGLARVEADWELTVVGRQVDAGYAGAVRERIDDAGVGDRVRLAGELTDAELAAVLRESHVLAVPSRHEGFGIVYLEGMSFGLPAIATAAGGAGEVVTDGETGFLVAPDDPGAVADAASTLATDRRRLAAMGRAARRRYERHPGWTASVARARRFLRAVADRPRAAAVRA